MKQRGFVLHYASDALKADKEVVLEAVKQSRFALHYAADALQSDALFLRLKRESCRGRRNLHVFKVKFAIRAVVAYWSKVAGKDDAYFDDEGEAVMAGSGARAAKRSFEEMTMQA